MKEIDIFAVSSCERINREGSQKTKVLETNNNVKELIKENMGEKTKMFAKYPTNELAWGTWGKVLQQSQKKTVQLNND